MDLKQILKLEKEIYFLKYLLFKPVSYIGEAVWDLITNIDRWLFFEFILLVFFVFEGFFINIVRQFPPVFNKKVLTLLVIIFMTFMIRVYFTQSFQQEYNEEKKMKIEKQFSSEEGKNEEETI